MKADSTLITWLLEESGSTKYSVSKATGIHQTTLANLEDGTSLIENLSFKNAAALTDYAELKMEEEGKMKKYLVEMVKYVNGSREIESSTTELETNDKMQALRFAKTLPEPGYGALVSIQSEDQPLERIKEITYEEQVLSQRYTSVFTDGNGTWYGSDSEPYPSDDGKEIKVKAYNIEGNPYMLTFKANMDFVPGDDSPEDWSDWLVIESESLELEEY
jgi:hypothetical protein